MTRRPLAAALFVGLVAVARPARAEGPFALTVTGCARLDEKEIARVLAIELHAVLPREDPKRPLRIDVACDGGRTRIDAYDPITDKRLSRDVDLPERAVDRDRTVAILASQLFLTSWSELLLRPSPGAASPSPPAAAAPEAAVDAARAKARAAVAASEPSSGGEASAEGAEAPMPAVSRRAGELWIGGGPRVRAWSDPFVSTRFSFRPAIVERDRLRLALDMGVERGSATRAPGSVVLLALSLTALGSWRSRPLGPLTFTAGGGAGIVYAGVAGEASTGASGSTASGVVGEALVALGPELAVGPATFALELSGGVTFPKLTARVEGDRDVTLGGPFAGASLLVGYRWGGR